MADIALTAAKISRAGFGLEIVLSAKLSATVTAGQALYQVTTGKYAVADANAANLRQVRGVALEGGAAGQVVPMLRVGVVTGFTLTDQSHDDPIFLSNTLGAFADAAGTVEVPVGVIITMPDGDDTKAIYFDIRYGADWV